MICIETRQLSGIWLLPAMSCGSLTVGILNVNNIRDLSADVRVGKNTVPVHIGIKAALYYHWCLIIVSIVVVLVFFLCYIHTPWPYTCLCTAPLLLRHGIAVSRQDPTQLTKQLQHLVLIIIVFVTLLSTGSDTVDAQHIVCRNTSRLWKNLF